MNQALLLLNMLAALGITLRLLTYQRHSASHNRWMALWAYGLIIASGATVIRTLTGSYTGPVDLSEVILKWALLIVIWRARGNVSCLIHPEKHDE